jgi:hypothetical protein
MMTQQQRDYLRRTADAASAADMDVALGWNVVLALLDALDQAETARKAAIARGAADHAVAVAARLLAAGPDSTAWGRLYAALAVADKAEAPR